MKKQELTTKDLGALHELVLFEQWASTKFKMYYDLVEDADLKTMFENISLGHADRRDALLDYLTTNAPTGGSK